MHCICAFDTPAIFAFEAFGWRRATGAVVVLARVVPAVLDAGTLEVTGALGTAGAETSLAATTGIGAFEGALRICCWELGGERLPTGCEEGNSETAGFSGYPNEKDSVGSNARDSRNEKSLSGFAVAAVFG